ncbi:NAD(P)-dependent oxidoreductase [Phytohabitans aurantiacus]|uniref:3-hydroxyisobutyrate dehydrogenase n=1 Tax=Phytohabitans aurantiacus TaxID=3016789 RepID=A0ABQ5QQC0_9ACTN|nr:NAD(P)-dependent oxidoreductase [Phytohabitans aurantiacus]GLH95796.1 3-hydroxyisobutyrate dehydrogenase [Phytohabitans aurantiacus]
MKVAIVGAGRMGSAMAARLQQAGNDVVVYNRTREKAEAVGAAVAETAREAAAWADTILVSLADDAAVLHAYGGPDGIAAGLRGGSVVVETSTLDPETVHRVAELVGERGAALLDGPVSGSVPLVEQGKLTFLVGGPADALDQVRPVLDTLAAQIFHVGPLGSGAVVKLAVNTVLLAINQAVAEALVLAERAEVPRETTYEVLVNSAIASPFVAYKRAAFERPDQTPVAFSLDLVAKDLGLIGQLAERVGAVMPQAAANRAAVLAALDVGMGSRDMAAIAHWLEVGVPNES